MAKRGYSVYRVLIKTDKEWDEIADHLDRLGYTWKSNKEKIIRYKPVSSEGFMLHIHKKSKTISWSCFNVEGVEVNVKYAILIRRLGDWIIKKEEKW